MTDKPDTIAVPRAVLEGWIEAMHAAGDAMPYKTPMQNNAHSKMLVALKEMRDWGKV